MNHFALAHFEQSEAATVPAEDDVRGGVVYGPANSLTGTAAAFATELADLATLNPSEFETSERTALDSFYERSGVPVDYIDVDAVQTRVQCLIVDRREVWDNDGGTRTRMEVLVVNVRRYNGTAEPRSGDVLVMVASNGTRRYKLAESPTESAGQLEWELEFSRKLGRAHTNPAVVPYG